MAKMLAPEIELDDRARARLERVTREHTERWFARTEDIEDIEVGPEDHDDPIEWVE